MELAVKHCDEYTDDEQAPAPLRKFLERARSPAHGALDPSTYPVLFADYKGVRVRVLMASRLGDVGITADLKNDYGYDARVWVADLSNFSETP